MTLVGPFFTLSCSAKILSCKLTLSNTEEDTSKSLTISCAGQILPRRGHCGHGSPQHCPVAVPVLVPSDRYHHNHRLQHAHLPGGRAAPGHTLLVHPGQALGRVHRWVGWRIGLIEGLTVSLLQMIDWWGFFFVVAYIIG